MSSIMRARSALTGWWDGWEVIGGSSLELKVAGPSMLGIGCPDRHALPLTPLHRRPKMHRPQRASSRESGFVLGWICDLPDLPDRSLKADLGTLAARIAARRRV